VHAKRLLSNIAASDLKHSTLISLHLPWAFPLCVAGHREKRAEEKEYLCPEGEGNGNFADPVTCRRFYQVIII
jgi:hypothetical protein